ALSLGVMLLLPAIHPPNSGNMQTIALAEIFEPSPGPNHEVRNGATASTGTLCAATDAAEMVFTKRGTKCREIAAAIEIRMAPVKPAADSNAVVARSRASVCQLFHVKTRMSDGLGIAYRGTRKARQVISHTIAMLVRMTARRSTVFMHLGDEAQA